MQMHSLVPYIKLHKVNYLCYNQIKLLSTSIFTVLRKMQSLNMQTQLNNMSRVTVQSVSILTRRYEDKPTLTN